MASNNPVESRTSNSEALKWHIVEQKVCSRLVFVYFVRVLRVNQVNSFVYAIQNSNVICKLVQFCNAPVGEISIRQDTRKEVASN